MRLADGSRLGYCTNIHPGESWRDVRAVLDDAVPRVRERLGIVGKFGVGLRLAAAAADALAAAPAFADFCDVLAAHDLAVFTVNGFPYGAFHGRRVKEAVYRPDWLEPERLRYTDRLADLLARLPDDGGGTLSISTVPGADKRRAAAPDAVRAIAAALIAHAARLVRIERATGKVIVLALEPEPGCLLETTSDAVAFFENALLAAAPCARFAAATGLRAGQAEAALRRHLGICLDACHAAVQFEEPDAAVDRLAAAGITIAKLQLSAGLVVPAVDASALACLAPFDEPVYLHQVVERTSSGLAAYRDLGDAIAAAAAAPAGRREWRIHYHVPIFAAALPPFASTQPFLAALLDRHRRQPVAPHLEVETYTWGVLPEACRDADVSEAIARELRWVLDRLGPAEETR